MRDASERGNEEREADPIVCVWLFAPTGTEESAVGDWLADVLMCSYAESLESKGAGRADIAFNCGGESFYVSLYTSSTSRSCRFRHFPRTGTLRGDSVYPAERVITLGDILEILPFEDPVVVIEMHGEAIWDCLESSLSKYPSQEGFVASLLPSLPSFPSNFPPLLADLSLFVLPPLLILPPVGSPSSPEWKSSGILASRQANESNPSISSPIANA